MSSLTSTMVSGTVAGSVSVLAGAPFDFVKVRLQTSEGLQLSTLVRTELKLGRHLFRGTGPALASAVLENSVVFGANLALKKAYLQRTSKLSEAELSAPELALLGGAAGVFSAVAICPAEMIKVRLQAAGPGESARGGLDCLRRVVRDEGARALFRGLPAQLARDVPFNLVFFSSFESICRGFGALRGGVDKKRLPAPDLILAGGLAGAVGWTVTLPMDLVKSRAQATRIAAGASSPSSLVLVARLVRAVHREAGLRGFFRGWTAAVARSFPVNGALFCTFEMCDRTLQQVLV